MKYYIILALFPTFLGCQNNPNFQGTSNCPANLENNKRTKKYNLKTCKIKIPIEWRYEKEMEGSFTVNKFINPSDIRHNSTSSNEKDDTIQNSSSILFLIEGESIEHNFEVALRLLEEDETTKVTEIIDTKFNDMNIKWVTYEDYSFISEGLTCSSFTTFITPENDFIGIIGQIIGEDLKEERMCHMIETIKSLNLKN